MMLWGPGTLSPVDGPGRIKNLQEIVGA